MAAIDRQLLEDAGLAPSACTSILKKSRQAISKGLAGDRVYFREKDLELLFAWARRDSPSSADRMRKAISKLFPEQAARALTSNATRDFVDRIGHAKRLWLILPEFAFSFNNARHMYMSMFDTVKQNEDLEIVAFCHRQGDKAALERQFDIAWFKSRRIATMICERVTTMNVMAIVDPNEEDRSCFVLSSMGFIELEKWEASRFLLSAATSLENEIKTAASAPEVPANEDEGTRPFDLIVADVKTIQTYIPPAA